MELKVKCNRWIWLACAVAVFILLGQWRCLEAKGNFSLFGFISECSVPRALLDMAKGVEVLGTIAGLTILGFVVLLYAAVSAGLGWVLAAIISMALANFRVMRSATTSECVQETNEQRVQRRLRVLVFVLAALVVLLVVVVILLLGVRT